MQTLDFVLYLIALLAFLVATFVGPYANPTNPPRILGLNFVALGLAAIALDLFIHAAKALG